jgi:hypothetical protein
MNPTADNPHLAGFVCPNSPNLDQRDIEGFTKVLVWHPTDTPNMAPLLAANNHLIIETTYSFAADGCHYRHPFRFHENSTVNLSTDYCWNIVA